MSIHMIRGYFAANGGMTESEIQTEIDDWISKRTEWPDNDPTDVQLYYSDPDEQTGTQYFNFTVRFEWAEDKDNTLQKCADKFKQKVDWFVLSYHVCDHDDSSQSNCGWDENWYYPDQETPPSDVPLPKSSTEKLA